MSTTVLPLKRFVDPARPITYGIVQAGPDVEGGVPYIRPVDMEEHRGVPDPVALRTTSREIAATYGRSRIQRGDVVVSIGPSFGKTMLVEDLRLEGANLTQGTARVAPGPGVYGRFLQWALQSGQAVAHWEASVGGATFRALNLGPLAETPVPRWELRSQRVIADYLDTETARIDALIAKKEALSQGVNERLGAMVSRSLGGDQPWRTDALPSLPEAWEWIAARHIFPTVTVGVVVNPSHYFTEVGVPFIHGTDIRLGEIDQSSLKHLSDEDSRGPLAKSRLQSGDVIAMRVGEPGRAAVVPPELEGANCASVIIFKRSGMLDSWLVAEFLNSSPGRAQVEMAQYGAAQGVLNVSDALAIRFPVPPLDVQRVLREQLGETRRSARVLIEKLSAQIALLEEHRQALITAAVTGELEVPGVAA